MRKQRSMESGLVVNHPLLRLLNYALLLGFVILVIAPILIVFLVSFKSNQEYMYSQVWDLPQSFLNFDNFKVYWKRGKMLLGFQNVGILIVVSLITSIFMGTMVAYVVTRFKFRGRKLILGLYVFAAVLPTTTTAIATFTVIKSLALYNTLYAGLLLYSAAGVLDIYMFMQFMYKIPTELDQSARVEGASYFRVYWSVILPLMRPAIATISILKVVGIYNDFFIPTVYMPSSKLSTITSGLMLFTQDRMSQWNVLSAGIIAVLLPTLIIYLAAQRFIISGVTDGAVKS
ncbi:carbohydrate ABC transporter permease [Paenibacillus mucilaginosus]|uniref:Binding-protein-dependent transport systems inner membrane component n=1 Tax=Paenibacillus mucilaginosus (strain KNP414) TaxID=1036673 RepID=F8FJC7_PAEMK|nr:carbohydrate ABC transporter permease [Paenibacillus mucilaginosus]AEI39890.1 binding-protein-dependent transport systems inner membrane component [Paenibacillus mucilaginosus KNP414]MCG7217211.1 carbohydrate ABC transporter permease [Paenibacillus mucilaginosus]WDM29167.1 carbohydrate ABC transporter permease [Paenibacillus mucilaginosus]